MYSVLYATMEDYDYDDLLHLMGCYSNYIQEFPDTHNVEGGEYPVSIYEFEENEYQEILKEIRGEE